MPTLRTLARLRSRSGERNSSARGVIASQPTNAQKSWTAAKPTAGQPNGASGANASARTSRTDASTTTTTSPSTPTVDRLRRPDEAQAQEVQPVRERDERAGD